MAMIYEDWRPVLVECRMKILKSGGNTDICLFALNWLSWFRVFVFSAAPCPIGPGNTPRCPDRWDRERQKKALRACEGGRLSGMAVGGGGKRYIMVSWNGWCVCG